MTTLTASRVAELPRINLLPPEIAQASRLRRLQIILGVVILGVLGLVVLLFIWASAQVSAANAQLAEAQATGASLQVQVDSYAEVPQTAAEVDAATNALATAMAPEIRWSFFLNDLSLSTPKSTRLVSMTATNIAAAYQLDGTTAPTPTQLGEPTMGSVTFGSKTNSFDAIGSWLQALARTNGYIEPTLQSGAKDVGEPTKGSVYSVSTTASLSLEAASDRYQQVLESE